MLRTGLTAIALTLFAGAAGAQIYTWKDANGRVHYSDSPPASANAQPVRGGGSTSTPAPASQSKPAAAASGPAAGPKSWAEKDLEYRQRKADQAASDEAKRKVDAQKAEKTAYCNDLQRNIGMLDQGGRVTQAGPSGEREFMSDEAIRAEADRLRAQHARDCR
ncbi:MAG: DUF4124 domain-containing protein [Moraxellaceae bacterium]|nr:DUF4124 domain-containing protein [Moraxellaceae bacterium]